MSNLRRLGAVTYSLGSPIPDNLKRVALVAATETERPDLAAYDVWPYTDPISVPANALPVAAIPFALGDTVPGNLRQIRNAYRYAEMVKEIAGSSLVALWPLWESAGDTAYDVSGHGYHGAYSGVTLGQLPGAIRPYSSPLFGDGDYLNLYSAGLAGAFTPSEGALLAWIKVSDPEVWTDGAAHVVANLYVNNSNRVRISKSTTNNRLTLRYIAGGSFSDKNIDGLNSTDWLCAVLTWSKAADQAISYLGGVQQGAALTGLGVWVGTLGATTTCIGAASTSGDSPWSGLIGPLALCNRALTAAEIAVLSRV
jgi:hypothetical protein